MNVMCSGAIYTHMRNTVNDGEHHAVQVAASEEQALQWEDFGSSSARATCWNASDHDEAATDSFGVNLEANIIMRPQLTLLQPRLSVDIGSMSITGMLGGCAVVTGEQLWVINAVVLRFLYKYLYESNMLNLS